MIFFSYRITCRQKEGEYVPARFNLYRDVHKSIRMYLSVFALETGRCDFSNEDALVNLKTTFKTIFDMFMIHTIVEDRHVLPEIKKYDEELYSTMEGSHHKVDIELEALKTDLEAIDSSADTATELGYHFYLRFNRFISENLTHLDEEERLVMPLLWKHMSDEELINCFAKLRADIPPALMQAYIRYMIASLKIADLGIVLKGVKAAAPAEAFNNILLLAKNLLNEEDNTQLIAILG